MGESRDEQHAVEVSGRQAAQQQEKNARLIWSERLRILSSLSAGMAECGRCIVSRSRASWKDAGGASAHDPVGPPNCAVVVIAWKGRRRFSRPSLARCAGAASKGSLCWLPKVELSPFCLPCTRGSLLVPALIARRFAQAGVGGAREAPVAPAAVPGRSSN